MRTAALVLPAALVLAACAAAPTAPSEPTVTTGTTAVRVTALYRERIMLPPGHVLTVRIEDVSLADAPARPGRNPGDLERRPYSVTLGLPTAQIDPRHTYAARAEIRDPAGALIFTTDTRHAVLTQGAPASAEIVLKSVR